VRILIISDIHSNLTALEAVLADAGDVDQTWCLGDVVGYGPDPNACVEKIRALKNLTCVLGNHDAAVLGLIDLQAFNYEARHSLLWQQKHLNSDSRSFLEELEERVEFNEFTLVHGSPRNPVWEYLMDIQTARLNFSYFQTRACLIGHTHLPRIFLQHSNSNISLKYFTVGEVFTLNNRFILNPGSVGQPRDRDPRAAYVIYDSEANTWQLKRVAYAYEPVQDRIIAAGLPRMHAYRLAQGI